jgi:hypothetical protein
MLPACKAVIASPTSVFACPSARVLLASIRNPSAPALSPESKAFEASSSRLEDLEQPLFPFGRL